MMLTSGPTPALGQHVLRSHKVALEIASAALGGEQASWVAEVGVGAGALTTALLQNPACAGVVGFELDERILSQALEKGGMIRRYHPVCKDIPEAVRTMSREAWEDMLVGNSRCFIFRGDVLTCRALPSRCSIAVGNIPYRISTAVVSKLLCQEVPMKRLVLMLQAEFARKLLAKPGSVKFGRVSALVQALCSNAQFAIPGTLPPDIFSPPPRVDSGVILLDLGEALRYNGVQVPAAALDQLLRLLLDGVRGPSRGEALEARLSELDERVATQSLPVSWRLAMARAGVDPAKPAMAMGAEEFVALAAELHRLGFASVENGSSETKAPSSSTCAATNVIPAELLRQAKTSRTGTLGVNIKDTGATSRMHKGLFVKQSYHGPFNILVQDSCPLGLPEVLTAAYPLLRLRLARSPPTSLHHTSFGCD